MTEVRFRVSGAEIAPFAASPQVALRVEVRAATAGARIQSILLRTTVRIEGGARSHDEEERARLEELFGGADVWARATRSLLWTQVTTVVPAFEGTTTFDVMLPCSYDLACAASKYLHGVTHGEVPITAQFSGTVFHETSAGLQVSPIPWDEEAPFRIPVDLWRRVIDAHFPNCAVLSLRREVFERLNRYRSQHGLVRWDDAVERLLGAASEGGGA